MKAIADLLAKKKSRRNYAREIDEKSIESVFFGLLEKKIPSIARVDILDFRLEEKKIYIKTAHPAIASEIWRKREGLKKEINNFLESESVEEIKVK
ncbi:MAG: hypothetical protein UX02_C0001G0229 [Candidatus Moranbacteria bacterium GW2011_GWC1_45_18]|nr:MAG: hypothetical protein UT79_C0002G0168 [Candidatus Moranbacteria bacterium GW2011_GWC2_40_12]KKT33459.1 MAG: hypothetical protein UW19_C0008G0002 [Candidatus Moranbacteria bacterium GW2011_GWF2_44_10]KKT72022.1 MAG: hypothetical protein UW66_C0016G0002 [Candidatus Moranbacteria bacterium GW2011_GWF1_44_4]KKU00781.1 MAG: hypothetical protein UX02_C0001G0229 [Candidatus Moranbacteria bacterium GW2011_GWC1_45_18]OGI24165.1 MAG: hypothetical protein A2194_02495 [Candidatus Moranbacteria bacte